MGCFAVGTEVMCIAGCAQGYSGKVIEDFGGLIDPESGACFEDLTGERHWASRENLKEVRIMSEPKTLMVNDVKYVREDSMNLNLSKDIRICILQRGWVAVGRFIQKDSDCVLETASVIRRWGTSNGLGELISGPLPDTTLDKCGTLRFHELAIVATLDCEAGKWEKHLK